MSTELWRLSSGADQALGRLDGAVRTIPNPDLFVAMYVRQEAVLSSQIEGTQASLTDVVEFEADDELAERSKDVGEVVNYVHAMNHGLQRLRELPLSLRLIKEIHGKLMDGVRGAEKNPGEFRKTQNWIGPEGSTLADATFVPCPPHKLLATLGELETFLHDETLPPVITAGLAHAQFETIHPFLDGNGRMGRLLVTFLLCQRKVIARPLLYLSGFLKKHRAEYYDRLQAIRTTGDWEQWLSFFLRGVQEVAADAQETARKILDLREHSVRLLTTRGSGGNLLRALDVLFTTPGVSVRLMERTLDVNYVTANKIIQKLVELGLLHEVTGYRRNRRFLFKSYLELFDSASPRAREH